jgi:2-iminobutanoate/2-iminopropanoate deaminase
MAAITRKVLAPEAAPKALGPYSLGIAAGDLVFASGTIGIDPGSGKLVDGGVEAQTHQALVNLAEILKAGGSSLAHVAKTTVFMTDLRAFGEMNAVYAGFFSDRPPARSTIQVAALPGGALVEIEAIGIVAFP